MRELWLAVIALGAVVAVASGEETSLVVRNATTYTVATQCPVYEDVDHIVFIPHEYDCTMYYVCKAGRKVPMYCAYLDETTGERLHFDPSTERCEWPGSFVCGGGYPPVPTPECVGNYKTQHENNCGYYYECVSGKKTLRACGGGLHFNPFAQTCQAPSQAGCEKSVPTAPPVLPTRPPVAHECVGNYKSHHESNCGYYYECVNGKKTLRACGGGLHFNPFAQTCQSPSEAGCEKAVPTPPPVLPTAPPAGHECVGSFKSPHENNCGFYYECVNGKKTLKACTRGLHFNAFSQTCQTPSEAGCDSSQPTPAPTPRPTPPPVGKECDGNFKSQHESNCGYYYECVNGKKTLKACGGGLHFNPFAQTCQPAANAGCDKTQPTPAPTPRPTPRPTPPPAAHECVGNFKSYHETNCGYYYECVNGKKTLRACGAGLHFNPFAQTCQTPSEAGCDKSQPSPVPTPRPTPRPTPPPAGHECVGGFKSSHEINCGFYYECVNGKKALRSCGGGLHFNPFAQTCQSPSEAGCDKSRPTPVPTPRPTPPPAGHECVGNFKSSHETNCGFYYECVNGKKTLRSCGGGLHFNPFAQTCQIPTEAGCDKSRPTPRPTARPTPPPADIECEGNFRSPHETQCEYYYECVNGRVTLRACGAGLHFNGFAQTCQTPSEAGCHSIFNALLRLFRGPHNFPKKVSA